MISMSGRVVLVAGGASGIGAATARLAVKLNGAVLICDKDQLKGEEIARELGEAARYHPLDVTNDADWTNAVAIANTMPGRFDAFVNTAAINILYPLDHVDMESAREGIAVNQIGQLLGLRHAAGAFCNVAGSAIVIIGSEAAVRGSAGTVVYAGTKAAVAGMARSTAAELAPYGVRVNLIVPGPIATPMFEEAAGQVRESVAAMVPLGRLGSAEEVANAIIFFLSDAASFITGAELLVDGGRTSLWVHPSV